MVTKVETIEELDDVVGNLSDGTLVVIDFGATWCKPCKAMLPVVEDLARRNPEVAFVAIDIDTFHDFDHHFKHVTSVPRFDFEVDGECVYSVVGADSAKLREAVAHYSGGARS